MIKAINSLGYAVVFDDQLAGLRDFLQAHSYSQLLILVDRNTNDHCLPVLQAAIPEMIDYDIIEIDPGEENKNIDYCIGVWKTLLDFGADRKALLMNLGGGVVTDMGGFAASTYKRGIDFIQVPTTLLAQVDASVGGKTGIDLDEVKNIVGTFTQPKGVFISTKFLETLDDRQMRSGFAEIIKHGLIRDRELYARCKQAQLPHLPLDVVYDSVAIKNQVVLADPKESGLRKILNFGHTIGHAIEGYSLRHDKDPLLHGEAIAIGMICEAYISSKVADLPQSELEDIVNYFSSLFPHYRLQDDVFPEALELMRNDKKNERNKLGFALLQNIGTARYNVYVEEELVKESLSFYQTLGG